ncbi:MAG: 2-oxo-4-hydroxy-4-carboxy-5-ureidoimidazoline decarboxylase [Rhodobacteraceae bacterium]|nr:2-oxo-4-hydroxy-4-carboxy-5-ureidoimidazoline decarboxylase [Paracoccaceae bacterium]
MTNNTDSFISRFGGVYEHSPWVAEIANRHKTPAEKDLPALMRQIVEDAGKPAQLALLRAHPDLAGKLAKTGDLTSESTSEQASAGLDQCTPEEFDAFTRLNDTYKSRFGFPYILAVRGRHRTEILENFTARVNNPPEVEFREALDQVHQIAALRLQALRSQ